MPEPEVRPERSPERRRAGCGAIALIVIGLLILVPSGLCTGFMTIYPIVMTLHSRSWPGDTGNFVALALMVGIPFIVAGCVLIGLGLRLRRR
jgi:uncharacterized membrane protein HdeD (DUF308 family)